VTESPNTYALALRLLTGRARSVADLRRRLQRKGCETADIEQALSRCLELGYLNDEQYATDLASGLMRRGTAVGYRLRQELKKQGIDASLAAKVIEHCSREFDENEILAAVMQRRYADIDLTNLDKKQKQRIINYLQRHGFDLAMILQYLHRIKD